MKAQAKSTSKDYVFVQFGDGLPQYAVGEVRSHKGQELILSNAIILDFGFRAVFFGYAFSSTPKHFVSVRIASLSIFNVSAFAPIDLPKYEMFAVTPKKED